MTKDGFQSLTIDSCVNEVRRAAAWFRKVSAGIDKQTSAECELALVEALTNIVKHGYNQQPGNDIKLHIKNGSSKLEFIVEDSGRPIPMEALQKSEDALQYDPDDLSGLPISGIGLALIKEIMSEFSYTSKDSINHLYLTKSKNFI